MTRNRMEYKLSRSMSTCVGVQLVYGKYLFSLRVCLLSVPCDYIKTSLLHEFGSSVVTDQHPSPKSTVAMTKRKHWSLDFLDSALPNIIQAF